MDRNALLIRNTRVGEDRPHMSVPHLVDVDGATWTVATDGWSLVAFEGEHAGAEEIPVKAREQFGRHLPGLIRDACTKSTMDVSLASLLGVAGAFRADKHEECPRCGGTGSKCTCGECECEYEARDGRKCDNGTLFTPAPTRPGFVFDRLVQLNRVAKVLEGLEEPVRAWSDGGEREPLMFAGDGWVAIVMPLMPESEENAATLPRWDARCTL